MDTHCEPIRPVAGSANDRFGDFWQRVHITNSTDLLGLRITMMSTREIAECDRSRPIGHKDHEYASTTEFLTAKLKRSRP